MRLRVILVGVVLLALVGGVMAARGRNLTAPRSTQTAAVASPAPASVAVAAARQADVVSHVLASGSVTSIRDAKIGSKISGRVAAVLVQEGARVGAGTPLLRLDASDLLAQQAQAQASAAAARAQLQKVLAGARPQERQQSTNAVDQARAALTSAQASWQLAHANLQREQSLLSQGAVSKQDVDTAQTQEQVTAAQVAQARASYDSAVQNVALMTIGSRDEDIQAARAQLAQAEAALAMVQVQLRDSTISAPFAGMIIHRSVEPGETVSSSSSNALFMLSQVADVYIELVVPAQHRSELRLGQEATMTVDGLPRQTFQGRTEEIRPAADAASRTFGVRVLVPNPQGILRPGMFARGAIIVGVRHGVLQIPEEAVMTASSGSIVFVVRNGLAVRQAVSLGTHTDGMVEITSGLTDGDKVIVQGQDGLTDNQPVSLRAL